MPVAQSVYVCFYQQHRVQFVSSNSNTFVCTKTPNQKTD